MNDIVADPPSRLISGARAGLPITRHDCIIRGAQLRWWTPILYAACRMAGRFVWFVAVRAKVIRAQIAERPGGYLLACTHLGHIEPFVISSLIDRQIDFMARIEFYTRWWSRIFLNAMGAFPVHRQGVPVSAVRTAIQRAAAGRVVGIFPEGGVVTGPRSVCRGGKIKRGVCVVAYRANVPIVPCVTLGTDRLSAVGPWLPFRRARLWIAFGEPIWPDRTLARRAAREQMAACLERACMALCRELINAHSLEEGVVP